MIDANCSLTLWHRIQNSILHYYYKQLAAHNAQTLDSCE